MKVLVGTMKTSVRNVSHQLIVADTPLLTVNFFQSELLSLSDKTENHAPSDGIEPGIEPDWVLG
jgi:hypothetical protein